MTKAELTKVVSDNTGYDLTTVREIIDATNDTIKKTMIKGEGVYMRGFGTFAPKVRKQKVARNITAGTKLILPEHRIATFKPAPEFKEGMKGKRTR
ncbi:HU family DNA-binding protein [Mucilaginibacter gynuensis]|uniref:HU family DNA-binding protein n=1 Tax=Mucilaginibacter gynuensis TaxID=1302236 RepID=A0ABP8HG13_9SPHI